VPTAPQKAAVVVAGGHPTPKKSPDWLDTEGETLYRGIFFGQGDILTKIPELTDVLSWRSNSADSVLIPLDNMVDELVGELYHIDSEFFAQFDTELRSGSQTRVSDMLNEASTKTAMAMDSIPETQDWRSLIINDVESAQTRLLSLYNAGSLSEAAYNEAQAAVNALANDEAGSNISFKYWIGIAIAVALAVAAPPVIAVAALVAWAVAYAFSAEYTNGSLIREELVNAVTTRCYGPL